MNNSSFNSCAMENGFEKTEEFTQASLFSGIGGFDFAAEWMGWKNIFHCEKEAFPRKILNYYWSNAISYEDIKTTDFTIHRGTIDVLTGGFPCQPYSTSGKRLGKEDDRHLWPEMLRAIQEIEPSYIVGENVYGLVNWNGGMVFNEVQADLEAEGYEVLPVILPACAKNAPHRRDRIWFVAYSNKCATRSSRTSAGIIRKGCKNNDEPKKWRKQAKQHIGCSNVSGLISDSGLLRSKKRQKQAMGLNKLRKKRIATNAQMCNEQWNWLFKKQQKRPLGRSGAGINRKRNASNANVRKCKEWLPEREQENRKKKETGLDDRFTGFSHNGSGQGLNWESFPTQSPVCGRNDGLPTKLDRITVSGKRGRRTLTNKQAIARHKKESIKAYGNAIVPQVAYEIFKAIQIAHRAKCGGKTIKTAKTDNA